MCGCLYNNNNNNNHCYCYYHCYDDNNDDVDDAMTAARWHDVGVDVDGGGTRSTMMREWMMGMSRQNEQGGVLYLHQWAE